MDGWNTSFLLGWSIFRGELLVLRGGINHMRLILENGRFSLHFTDPFTVVLQQPASNNLITQITIQLSGLVSVTEISCCK